MADAAFTSQSLNTAVSQLSAPTNVAPSGIEGEAAADLTGPFEYVVTAFNGGETPTGTGFYIDGTGSSISVGFTEVAGASDYRIYRSISGLAEFALVAQGSGSPVTDSAAISGAAPPQVNTTDRLSRGLGSQPVLFYTVPSSTRTLLKEVLVSNSYSSEVTFRMHLCPTGEAPNSGNAIIEGVTLASKELKLFSLNTLMAETDTIYACTSDIGLTPSYSETKFKISGIEIT